VVSGFLNSDPDRTVQATAAVVFDRTAIKEFRLLRLINNTALQVCLRDCDDDVPTVFH
jgi:hypothetical protein